MAEQSRFWNNEVGDVREYQAAEFSEYFSRFLNDGVYSENNELGLKVSAGSGLDINVATGYAYIKGYMYENDAVLNKTIEPADSVLNRIDRVAVRFDEVAREIKTVIKTGTFASSPVPPTLEDTGIVKELSLAKVIVNKNATTVQIVDERLTEFCGQVSLLIDVPLAEFSAEFDNFLVGLEEVLDENTAGNLLNMINDLEKEVTPVGGIIMWSGSIIPDNWGLCDGSLYTRSDGQGSVQAPDLRDKFIVGAGNAYNPGDTGGEDRVSLLSNQLPSHNHSLSLSTELSGIHSHTGEANSAGSHVHSFFKAMLGTYQTGSSSGSVSQQLSEDNTSSSGVHNHSLDIDNAAAHTHNISGNTDSKGLGESHENKPPYYALAFIMKI